MRSIKSRFFILCPKTNRIIGLRPLQEQATWLFPFVGLAALIWVLIRVVPKPSRAAYPCQRVAMPLATSFLAWLLGSSVSTVILRKFNLPILVRRLISVTLCISVAICLLGRGSASATIIIPQSVTPEPSNNPIGTAKGLMPGRVTWAHDPSVTDWNGSATSSSQAWFNHVSQTEATNMMQWAIMSYAGTTSTSAAWDAIFRYFNGGTPYQSGEKIFIKVNMTTTQADACADSSYNWIPANCGASWTTIGTSPQLEVALLDQLVNVVGVAQSDITIGDTDSLWVNELYNPVHNVFPNVKYLDARGTLGRTQTKRSTVRLYWSTTEANGKNPDYLPQALVDAKYMINLAVLKTHERNGITLTAKNNFGLLSGGNNNVRKPNTSGYYDLHARLPLETEATAWPDRAKLAQYRPLVDLNGDTGIGGKTILYLIDGIFGGEGADPRSTKWSMTPFNNYWPSSLFVSMDQVAIDSVGFDFLSVQYPTYTLAAEGVTDYLREMALANNPPSGTFYDPEGDGIAMTSQGVHEHWNNSTNKQYTRNLSTGNGIELVYINHDPNGTPTPTSTPSKTATPSPSATATASKTSTKTPTKTYTPSYTSTLTPTLTGTLTVSSTPTRTPTRSATFTRTRTATYTTSRTPTRTPTPTLSRTPTRTNTPTATRTKTPTRTITPQANLLTNGDMENGTTGWSVYGSGTLSADTSVYHGGTHSLKITGRTAARNGPSQTINGLVKGQSYTVKVWVRSQTNSPTAKATLQLTAGSTTNISLASATVTSSGWTLLSGTANVTWSGTLTSAKFYVQTNSGTDNFYIDDAQLYH